MINNLLLSLKETYMSFGKKEIFKDINLNIHKGDFIALVGKNGVGKSTLMRIICDKLDIDQGEIWKANNLKISYFSQIFDLNENNTIEKELSLILDNKEEDYKIDIFCNNLHLIGLAGLKSFAPKVVQAFSCIRMATHLNSAWN